MLIGFVLFEVGSVLIWNMKSVLVKNVLDLCVSGVVYYVVGYGLVWGVGEDGFVGRDGFGMWLVKFDSVNYVMVVGVYVNVFFLVCFVVMSVMIVLGVVVEWFLF